MRSPGGPAPRDPRGRLDPFALIFRLLLRTKFRIVEDVDGELRKVDVIRVAVGLVLFARTALIADSSRFWFDGQEEVAFAVAECVLAVALAFGVATPLTIGLLLATYYEFDLTLGTHTLGTLVLIPLLLYLLIAAAGTTWSVDRRLIASRPESALGRLLRALYTFVGTPDGPRLTVASFLLLTAYAAISAAAALNHWADDLWRNGRSIELMMTGSYFSRGYEVARTIDDHAAWVFSIGAPIVAYVQLGFQLLMLPLLLLSRWTYWFVVFWGAAFVAMSAALLHLSYLPLLEALLWIAVFAPPPRPAQLAILYDDRCNLCRGTVRVLRALDLLRVYDWRPLSHNADFVRVYGLGPAAKRDLHALKDGRVHAGYETYVAVARANPVLWPLYPILVLARVLRVGPAVYRFVARRRERLFGTCAAEPTATPPLPARVDAGRDASVIASVVAGVWAVALALFPWQITTVQANALRIGLPRGLVLDGASNLEAFEHRIGLKPPDVFNRPDLLSSTRWPVVRREVAGHTELVPLHAEDGAPLEYVRSDIVHYGASRPWRLLLVDANDVSALDRPGGRAWILARRIAVYDRRRRGAGPTRYRVEVYAQDGDRRRLLDAFAVTG